MREEKPSAAKDSLPGRAAPDEDNTLRALHSDTSKGG